MSQAYTKLSKSIFLFLYLEKIPSNYDENAIYGMTSTSLNKVKIEKNNEFYEKSNDSFIRDNNLEEDEDNEEFEGDDEEIDRNLRKNQISKKPSQKTNKNNLSNGKVSKNGFTPVSIERDQETFHTEKHRNNSENKNLAFILNANKNQNIKTENINRYSSNPPNNNISHNFSNQNYYPSNDYRSNGYNNYSGNNGYNNNAFTSQNYYDPQNYSNFQNNNFDTNENFLFPRNQNTINCENNPKDQNSCSYCEEYYKMALFKNLPLKLLICPYCNNTINQNALQFYYKKYENEINLSMKKMLNAEFNVNSGKNSPKFLNNNTLNGTIEYQNISTNPTKNLSILDENKKEDFNKYNNIKIMDNVEELVYEEENNIDSKNNLSYEKFGKHRNVKENNNEENKISDQNKELITIKIDEEYVNNDNTNLAEMFRKRKLEMIQKFEKRKLEKDIKIETINDHTEERSKTKVKKHEQNSKKQKEQEKTVKHSSVEPSPSLLHRLSLGEKAIVNFLIKKIVIEKGNKRA